MTASSKTARNGFTIVELLVATILASLMLAAVLGVLTGLSRQHRQIEKLSPNEPWQGRFLEQLEWDLMNSRKVIPVETGFFLEGFAGKDPVTGTISHRPTIVEYSVRTTDKSSLLIRKTMPNSPNTIQEGFSEVVGFEIQQISLTHSMPSTSSTKEDVVPLSDGPIPASLAVLIFKPETSEPILTHAFILR